MLTTADVAKDLIAKLRAGDFAGSQALWAEDVVSLEAAPSPMQVCKGIAAVKAKTEWWDQNHEIHGFSSSEPWVNGDQFAVTFKMDVTSKLDGQRHQMEEIAVYTVRDGKIIEERFFYPSPDA